MTSKWSFLIFGLVALAKAQQGYPRENPADQLVYNSGSQMYDDEEVSSGDEIPGEAGKDYPTLRDIPETQFDCGQQQFPGYYAETETRCQVFHICQIGGRKDSFLCPNGTVFNQEKLVCDWWFNFDCAQAQSFYSINEAVVRAMEDADRIAAEKTAAEGYRYAPNGSKDQQRRPFSPLNGPQSDFDTVVVESTRTLSHGDLSQKSQPQRGEIYDRPEIARGQSTGPYVEDNRRNSNQITHATFGKQISAGIRDADMVVQQELGREYLPAEI